MSSQCCACHGELSLFGKRLNYEYHKCLSCGTIQLVPLPTEAELRDAYVSNYVTADHYEENPDLCKASARTYYHSIVNVLDEYSINKDVLDYGSGWGGLCEMLMNKGIICKGIEMSCEMVSYSQKQGLPVQQGDITAIEKEKDVFSALALCTVFEHLINHDEWMEKARLILRENGLIISLQPTSLFPDILGQLIRLGKVSRPLPQLHQVFCPPWHTVLFSIKGMEDLALRNGFELVEVRPAPQGRVRGMVGFVQICLEYVNRIGWSLMGIRWPLLPAHIFILKKV